MKPSKNPTTGESEPLLERRAPLVCSDCGAEDNASNSEVCSRWPRCRGSLSTARSDDARQ